MALSLYAATIPTFQQILAAVSGLLDKAEAHYAETGVPLDDLMQARLADDMLPFGYQVKATVIHSLGGIEGVRKGVFVPDMSPFVGDFPALRQLIVDAQSRLNNIDPDEINSFEGRDTRFEFGEYRWDFTAEDFLLSFSQPNFHFHAATAYDILRAGGVQVGKVNYLGNMRLKS